MRLARMVFETAQSAAGRQRVYRVGPLRVRLVRDACLWHLTPSLYAVTEHDGRALCAAWGRWNLELSRWS